MSDALKILFLSPGSIIGFFVGLLVLLLFRWKPSVPLWWLTALLHLPTFIFISALFQKDVTAGTIISTLIIYFGGTAGLGFALVLWLILPNSIRNGSKPTSLERRC
jgi:hypothetical protein